MGEWGGGLPEVLCKAMQAGNATLSLPPAEPLFLTDVHSCAGLGLLGVDSSSMAVAEFLACV